MSIEKLEINQLIDSLGNEPRPKEGTADFVEWMGKNNPLSDISQSDKKPKCKSGKCGNNKFTFTIVGIIVVVLMLAGHGLFTLIEKLF